MKFIEKIYIIHYQPLTERKKYLDSVLKNFKVPYEFVINNPTTDKVILEKIDEHYSFNSSILPRKLKIGEIAVSVSHLNVYKDILKNKYQYCLIIEDDAVFDENFLQIINSVMDEKKDYDFIFLSTCCNLHKQKSSESFLYESETSRCVTGYVVRNKNLQSVLDYSIPISTPIDTNLNHIKGVAKLKYAWCEPPIINQGSENVYKSNLR